MNKLVVNEDNYKRIVLKRMIIVCWILLAICFGIKLFGGNFFSIVCTNETFVKVCNFIDNTAWYYVIGFITFYISTNLYLLAVCGKTKFNKYEFALVNAILILMYLIKFISLPVSMFTDAIGMFLIPMLFRKEKFWKRFLICLFGFILFNVFQILSLLIKNIGIVIINYSSLVSLIFSIDYYIMLVLYYLYANIINKKEV